MPNSSVKNLRLGQMLVEAGLITQPQLDEALARQRDTPDTKLGDLLVQMGYIDERALVTTLSVRLKVPYVDLGETRVDPEAAALISEDLAKKYNIIPIAAEGKMLTVATSDPMNLYALDDVRLATNMEVRVVLSAGSDIRAAIGTIYSTRQTEAAAQDLSRAFDAQAGPAPLLSESLEERIDNAPVVRLVNSMIQQAVRLQASDIHIEPMEEKTRVRMRVDGVLQEQMTLASAAHASIVTRLKIMGGMNIAEKRIPQDGRVEMQIDGKNVDLRLSVLPTVTGEKVVIRVLGGMDGMLAVEDLGLSDANYRLFSEIIKSPNGMILVSGPTGSGKTTTLYAILSKINHIGCNIITVEDPVEYRLPGVNQVQVNPKAGLDFASGLRSILRQDPDIIMIGEIRDSETAQIAVRAAITGHLVLSTIHTNDAASTVTRLVNMGVEPYLVSSAVVGVAAQRLVRRICPRCKAAYSASEDEQRILRLEPGTRLYRGAGCNFCDHTGYKGRVAIHEILAMNHKIRGMVDRNATADELRAQAVADGTLTLQQSCRELVLDGTTTLDEMLRATYNIG